MTIYIWKFFDTELKLNPMAIKLRNSATIKLFIQINELAEEIGNLKANTWPELDLNEVPL